MFILAQLLWRSHVEYLSAKGIHSNGAWRSVVIVVRDDAARGAMQLFCRDNGLLDAVVRLATPEEIAEFDSRTP